MCHQRLAWLLACCALWTGGALLAGVRAVATPVPEAAAEDQLSCRASSYATKDARDEVVRWPRQAPALPLESSCWVGADALGAWQAIDVRLPVARHVAPVLQALPMDLDAVAGKRFLQQESILLLGNGLDYADLSKACRDLQAQGFAAIRALVGGAPAWAAHLQATTGARLKTLTPGAWVASLGQGIDWTIWSFDPAFQQAPQQWPVAPQQVLTVDAMPATEAQWRTSLAALARSMAASSAQSPGVPRALLVIPAPGWEAREIAEFGHTLDTLALPRSIPTPVYWLDQGWSAYQRQVTQTQSIQHTASHRLQPPCGRF